MTNERKLLLAALILVTTATTAAAAAAAGEKRDDNHAGGDAHADEVKLTADAITGKVEMKDRDGNDQSRDWTAKKEAK